MTKFTGIGHVRLRPLRNRGKRPTVVAARTVRTDFIGADQRLKQRGWQYLTTVWLSAREGTFGRCYTRDGKMFWLNHRTVNQLPN